MIDARSSVGLSPSSIYLETVMYSCSSVYGVVAGNPFATYGENVMLILQNMLIILLMWTYSKSSMIEIFMALAVYGGFVYM